MDDLSGKVAVVTGAASGIGRAMAKRFAAEGMRVVLADVEAGPLEAAASRLKEDGYDVAAFRVDVTRPDEVRGLAEFTLEKFGSVQVLCNNAGVGIGGTLWEHSPEDWQWLLGVNVLGVVNGLREIVPVMLNQGDQCHIVNTASAAGLDARAWLGMYSATKYAVVAISEALQAELRMRAANIGVSVLCPALVNTRIAESERNRPGQVAGEAEDLAPDAQAFDQAFRAALAQGLPPAQVAGAVVEAIRIGRFYIITQAETEARVRDRFSRILDDASLAVA
jgi:NAD(P)-dependent dehydrogenase (short-subunit alcohol dehydrogenase family)